MKPLSKVIKKWIVMKIATIEPHQYPETTGGCYWTMPLPRLFTHRLIGMKASQKKSLMSAPIRQARKTSIVNWTNLPHRMNNLKATIVGQATHLMKYPDALELPPRGKITKNHHHHQAVLLLKLIEATMISSKALLHKN